MNKTIIGLVGEIASGKDTVAQYLKEKYNSETVGFSKPLRDFLDRLYLPQTRENMVWLGHDLRQRFGEHVLAYAITKEAEAIDKPFICLPNVRTFGDIEFFKKMPNFILVQIFADQKTRYERLIKRSQNSDDQTKTWEQFLADAQLPTEISIREVAKEAKYTIDNNGNFKELYRQVNELIEKIN